jgi:hypothetical protein
MKSGVSKYIASIEPPTLETHKGWSSAMAWCSTYCKHYHAYRGEGVFEFTDEKEYLMFVLKFGS